MPESISDCSAAPAFRHPRGCLGRQKVGAADGSAAPDKTNSKFILKLALSCLCFRRQRYGGRGRREIPTTWDFDCLASPIVGCGTTKNGRQPRLPAIKVIVGQGVIPPCDAWRSHRPRQGRATLRYRCPRGHRRCRSCRGWAGRGCRSTRCCRTTRTPTPSR